MQTQQFAYPFDPNGTAPSNLVVGERHTITPINGGDFRFLVPKAAPYFRNSLIVKHVATNRILTDGVDYQPGHRYDAASNTAPFLSIFGSILIMDNTLEGTFEIQYQTLGGEHTVDESVILAMLANTQIDPRMTKWDVILETPGVYDPLLHRQHVADFVGWDDAVVAINRLVDAVIEKMENGAAEDPVARSHIANRNNPHEVRLAQLPDGAHLAQLTAEHVAAVIDAVDNGNGLGGGGKFKPTEPGPLDPGAKIVPDNSTPNNEYTLPENPEDMTTVEFIATPISFETNPIRFKSVDKIMGAAGPIVVNGHGECGLFIYFEAFETWWLYRSAIGAGGIGSNIGLPGDAGDLTNSKWVKYSGAPITKPTKLIPNNATAPVTLPMPINPTDLFEIEWEAGPAPFSQNAFIIQPSDKPVDGAMTAIVINTDGECGRLRYFSDTQTWVLYKTGIAAGGSF